MNSPTALRVVRCMIRDTVRQSLASRISQDPAVGRITDYYTTGSQALRSLAHGGARMPLPVIERGGENISPTEIEDTLLRHPAVVAAAGRGSARYRVGREGGGHGGPS